MRISLKCIKFIVKTNSNFDELYIFVAYNIIIYSILSLILFKQWQPILHALILILYLCLWKLFTNSCRVDQQSCLTLFNRIRGNVSEKGHFHRFSREGSNDTFPEKGVSRSKINWRKSIIYSFFGNAPFGPSREQYTAYYPILEYDYFYFYWIIL